MDREKFITFIESLYNADDTSGSSLDGKLYFRAIYIGYEYPNLGPPAGDEVAEDGYKLGLKLRKL